MLPNGTGENGFQNEERAGRSWQTPPLLPKKESAHREDPKCLQTTPPTSLFEMKARGERESSVLS